jgi:hypothetical protein
MCKLCKYLVVGLFIAIVAIAWLMFARTKAPDTFINEDGQCIRQVSTVAIKCDEWEPHWAEDDCPEGTEDRAGKKHCYVIEKEV